jgi:hypothetical protein
MSKKKIMQIQKEEEQKRQQELAEIQKLEEEEEEWMNSKHIQQLNHMADICVDYNNIVDNLEDEH